MPAERIRTKLGFISVQSKLHDFKGSWLGDITIDLSIARNSDPGPHDEFPLQ